ncbi:MAG: glycosyl hydrolase family 18 protein [Candidatus Curtissbacteria bacterium]|nr:glycosyl hydrolase family 18 protein [Candidatus Curtissbacteria bacterium]
MPTVLSDPLRRKFTASLMWGIFGALILGVFFLGLFLTNNSQGFKKFISPIVERESPYEVFGFAPFWTLSKMDNIDWDVLTTFAYFSLPLNADGTIDKNSHEWSVFEGDKLSSLFQKAKNHQVKRVVTLTQMDASTIEVFLENPEAWNKLAYESVDVIKSRDLDGVNIDIEYIPSNNHLKDQFSQFVQIYSGILNKNLDDPYITVSVLASSARFNRIYDVGKLAEATDGVFMMAYDFYYPGSETIGPSAPLYGYNGGKGPFWYDVSTAVDDFLKVASADKIIMGVPYYGWTYPAAAEAAPKSDRNLGLKAFATTLEKAQNNKLLSTTPIGGWDSQAQVAWRGYWDDNGWHVVYMEDEKSLSIKYDFAKEKKLAGVGMWALGFDADSDNMWSVLAGKFDDEFLSSNNTNQSWIF